MCLRLADLVHARVWPKTPDVGKGSGKLRCRSWEGKVMDTPLSQVLPQTLFLPVESAAQTFAGREAHWRESTSLRTPQVGKPRDAHDGRLTSGEIRVDGCKVKSFLSASVRSEDQWREVRKKRRFLPEHQVSWSAGHLPLDRIV